MKAPEASAEAPRPKWIWATSYLKIALNPIGAASALALIAVWLMEFNWPSAHAWFGKYPVTIGLITGLLNLIFTVSLAGIPGTFKKATRNREHAVTKEVEWPW